MLCYLWKIAKIDPELCLLEASQYLLVTVVWLINRSAAGIPFVNTRVQLRPLAACLPPRIPPTTTPNSQQTSWMSLRYSTKEKIQSFWLNRPSTTERKSNSSAIKICGPWSLTCTVAYKQSSPTIKHCMQKSRFWKLSNCRRMERSAMCRMNADRPDTRYVQTFSRSNSIKQVYRLLRCKLINRKLHRTLLHSLCSCSCFVEQPCDH